MIQIPEGFPSIIRKNKMIHTPIKRSTLQTGNALVLSIPPGGEIYIDTVSTGTYASKLVTGLSVGSHDIKVTLPGYVDFLETVTIDDGMTRTIFAIMTPTSPPTGTGTLNVTSIPSGAEFGIYAGVPGTFLTPVVIPDIPAGINAYEGFLTNYTPALGSFVINSGETTSLNLRLAPYDPNMGLAIIESTPMGAEIFIDSINIGTRTSFMTMMSPGPYSYELRMPGYVPVTGTFDVVTGADNPAIVSAQLQMYGKMIVFSIPPGARIFDGIIDTGINSSAIISEVIPGDHTITLKLSGYEDYTTSSPVTISPGGTETIFAMLIPSIPPSTGDLYVTSIPDGIPFELYTGESGTTPTTLTGVPALINPYTSIGKPGFNMVIGSVDIKPGETTNLNIILQPDIAGAGLAVFESIPTGADIYIGGVLTGAKTSYATLFEPGTYAYELRLPGYTTAAGNFTVVTGTDNPAIVSVRLQQGGAGAVMLLGVAALGMIALSKKPPS